MKNHGIWRGKAVYIEGETVLAHSFHQAPLKVAKPFHRPNGELFVIIMDASPGLFNGDQQEIACTLEENARLTLTTQSSCRLHPSVEQLESRQSLHFRIGKGALLDYAPGPLVPFQHARHTMDITVELEEGGQAILSEIISPGRIERGERFAYSRIISQFTVFLQHKRIVWERLILEPSQWEDPESMFRHYSHIGTLWILSKKVSQEDVKEISRILQSSVQEDIYGGASMLISHGMVVRLLGHSVHQLEKWMNICRKAVIDKLPNAHPAMHA